MLAVDLRAGQRAAFAISVTIASAATFCEWLGHEINIIDTPGHVDFTIEVERSLRVLDGAILVLCSVGGVQSQSITVDQQMKRYRVPGIAFINKCDRSGADPSRVIAQLRTKLGHNAVALQIPIGLEMNFQGVVDLIDMKALYFEGENGEGVRTEEIPAGLRDEAAAKRAELIEAASMFSDELMEAALEEREIPREMLIAALRTGTIRRELTPVLMGSAYKNKAVQPLLDAVCALLPCPADVENTALDMDHDEAPVTLASDPAKPVVALAFKLEDGPYGQLTYIRVYQGRIAKGSTIVNVRTGKKVKVGRVVRMHADQMEDIEAISAGYIGALFGIECASGDTFVSPGVNLTMTSMYVPEPVISLAIVPKDNKAQVNMSKALNRFTKEDPTFRCRVDAETNETIIEGMGELHLEIIVDRMKREFNVEANVGKPQVAYRETVRKTVTDVEGKFVRQSGGKGQYGHVVFTLEPQESGKGFEFVDEIKGGVVPREYIPAVEKGVVEALTSGVLAGYPVVDVKVRLTFGSYHDVDSSEQAFKMAAIFGFKEAARKANPVILEPMMAVEVETPEDYAGTVMGDLSSRRGMVQGMDDMVGGGKAIKAEVPLSEMFGYATTLRSMTQGRATYTMEFKHYSEAPKNVAEAIVAARAK